MILSYIERRKQAVFYSTIKYGCDRTRTYILFCDKTRVQMFNFLINGLDETTLLYYANAYV